MSDDQTRNPRQGVGQNSDHAGHKNSDNAEPLYAEMGYVTAGTIPRYCRDPFIEQLHATAIMHKAL